MLLHFIRPYWLLALIPLAVIVWKMTFKSGSNNWEKVCDPHLLPYLVADCDKKHVPWLMWWMSLCWFLAVFALAGPSFSHQHQTIYRNSTARIILLSLSPSMYETGEDQFPKINRARYKIFDLLKNLKEGVNGLVVFTEYPFLVSPLTEDINTLTNLVPLLEPNLMPVAGNNTASAIREAKKLFEQAGLSSGDVILITDKIENFFETDKAAQELQSNGFHLYILNLSKDKNEDLSKLAQNGGGKVIPVTADDTDIDELNYNFKKEFSKNIQASNMSALLWKDSGRWVAAFILPLALMAFRRGYL